MLPPAHEAHKLHHHDPRAGRRLGQTQSVHHLSRLEPAIMEERLLGDVRQHSVSAAKGDHGGFAKENALAKQSVIPALPKTDRDCWRSPEDEPNDGNLYCAR